MVVHVLERDPRCKMITFDSDTAESNPAILRKVVKVHNGTAGIYGAVMVEETVAGRQDQIAGLTSNVAAAGDAARATMTSE